MESDTDTGSYSVRVERIAFVDLGDGRVGVEMSDTYPIVLTDTEEGVETDHFTLTVERDLPEAETGRAVTVGIRPEHITIAEDATFETDSGPVGAADASDMDGTPSRPIPVRTDVLEPVGDDIYVYSEFLEGAASGTDSGSRAVADGNGRGDEPRRRDGGVELTRGDGGEALAVAHPQRDVAVDPRVRERLIGICLIGALAFSPPLLTVFGEPALIFGLPLLYVYTMTAWAGIIGLTARLVTRSIREDGSGGEERQL